MMIILNMRFYIEKLFITEFTTFPLVSSDLVEFSEEKRNIVIKIISI